MSGYRWVEEGETIPDDAEYYEPRDNTWVAVRMILGEECHEVGVYRTSEPKS